MVGGRSGYPQLLVGPSELTSSLPSASRITIQGIPPNRDLRNRFATCVPFCISLWSILTSTKSRSEMALFSWRNFSSTLHQPHVGADKWMSTLILPLCTFQSAVPLVSKTARILAAGNRTDSASDAIGFLAGVEKTTWQDGPMAEPSG